MEEGAHQGKSAWGPVKLSCTPTLCSIFGEGVADTHLLDTEPVLVQHKTDLNTGGKM